MNPRCFYELDAPVHWHQFTFDVAPNVIVNSADGLEFTFHPSAMLFGKGHQFFAKSKVLLVA